MRQKFEENRHIKDPIKAKQILEEATEKFEYIRHPDPILCKFLNIISYFYDLIVFLDSIRSQLWVVN